MELKKAIIRNFGTISNKTYDFTSGINSYIDNNGKGKSTLAYFIKAMLYGLDNVKVNSSEFKDRKHYEPFNGGSFGGTLEFVHNGHYYHIERTFDSKSNSKDEIKIIIDKEEEKEKYNQEIGERLLNLDKEAFERLLFITSEDIKMESNGNIKKNLNNIINDTAEGVDYDAIVSKLDELDKSYTKKGGVVPELKEKKKALEEQIENKKRISSSLAQKYEVLNKLTQELDSYTKLQANYTNQKSLADAIEVYNQKAKQIEDNEDELNKLLSNYPNGVPSEEELKKLTKLNENKIALEGKSKGITFDEEKDEKYKKLSKKFVKGPLNEEIMTNLSSLYKEEQEFESSINNIKFSKEEQDELDVLKLQFKDGYPSENELNEIENKVKEYNRLETLNSVKSNELSKEEELIKTRFDNQECGLDADKLSNLIQEYKGINDSLHSIPRFSNDVSYKNGNKSKSKLPLIIAILSLAILGAGVGLMFAILALGIVLLVIGIIGLFISMFIYFKDRLDKSNNGISSNEDYLKKEAELHNKENELHAILTKYQIYSDSIQADYERFKNDYSRYQEILNKLHKMNNDNVDELTFKNLEKEISTFLHQYVYYSDFSSGLEKLKDNLKDYHRLSASYQKYEKELNENIEKLNQKKIEINNVLTTYEISLNDEYNFETFKKDNEDLIRLSKEVETYLNNLHDIKTLLTSNIDAIKEIDDKYSLGLLSSEKSLDSINNEINKINMMKETVSKDKESLAKYKKEKGIEENIDSIEAVDYTDKITSLKADIVAKDDEITMDENECQDLSDLEEELNSIIVQIKEIEKHRKILEMTKTQLSAAQKILNDKYVAPIMNKFNYYSKLLGDVLGVDIEMGRNFNIQLNVNGQIKDEGHLSSGQRSICALCFRLALLDNIYFSNLPFIVMDDPFVSLDEDNINSTSKMLKELAKGKQIIYFACHNSRAI